MNDFDGQKPVSKVLSIDTKHDSCYFLPRKADIDALKANWPQDLQASRQPIRPSSVCLGDAQGVLRNADKAVEGEMIAINKGTLFEGVHAEVGPPPVRLGEFVAMMLQGCTSEDVAAEATAAQALAKPSLQLQAQAPATRPPKDEAAPPHGGLHHLGRGVH